MNRDPELQWASIYVLKLPSYNFSWTSLYLLPPALAVKLWTVGEYQQLTATIHLRVPGAGKTTLGIGQISTCIRWKVGKGWKVSIG